MKIKNIRFLVSNVEFEALPAPDRPEYAFVGRSNVGKSSLINMLANHEGLAKISGQPGKTQTINHFLVNEAWYLVDLPGYGYAKASKGQRGKWLGFSRKYLRDRENLYCVFCLMDARHELKSNDIEFLSWIGEEQVPFTLVYTKADKLSKTQLDLNIQKIEQQVLEVFEELPPRFTTSAKNKLGKAEILDFIARTNESTA